MINKSNNKIAYSLKKLKKYCEAENFKGWDPYDGLNSKVFQALPLKNNALCRLLIIQAFKRNPINLRKLFLVPKEYNAKGLGLFLTAYCNLYKNSPKKKYLNKINFLANKLIEIKSKGYSGDCWGYNFDWQAYRGFFFQKETPNIVVTCFVAYSLFDAYDITKKGKYLKSALSSTNFIIKDLIRTPQKEGFLFSYSPIKGNNTVYNASLLGSKLLARAHSYKKNNEWISIARESVLACVNAQQTDGSWFYGESPTQNWIDSFHTGYNLEAIYEYQKYSDDKSFSFNIDKGINYYLRTFFIENGTPQYYNNKIYPIDIHSPAQLIITLCRMNLLNKNKKLALNVLNWTIKNMQDKKGYFYYQLKKRISSKISYIRWSQSWMFYTLSLFLLKEKNKIN